MRVERSLRVQGCLPFCRASGSGVLKCLGLGDRLCRVLKGLGSKASGGGNLDTKRLSGVGRTLKSRACGCRSP